MEVVTIHAVQWEITMACNLACEYCYNVIQVPRPCHHTPSLSRSHALDIASRIVEANIKRVVLSGGEPLIRPDIVVEVGQFLSTQGVAVSVITNGTTLTEKLAKKLKKAGVEVFVSLSAPLESLHDDLVQMIGAYRKSVRGIEILVKEGFSTGINMVVSQKNKDFVTNMGFFVCNLGVKEFSASRFIPPWNSRGNPKIEALVLDPPDVRKMFSDLKFLREQTNLIIRTQGCYPLCLMADFSGPTQLKYCSIGGPALAIGVRGEIRPCAFMPQVYGNVLTEGFKPALSRMSVWREDAVLPAKCRTCELVRRCTGGCRVAAHFSGNVNGLDMHASPLALEAALGHAEGG